MADISVEAANARVATSISGLQFGTKGLLIPITIVIIWWLAAYLDIASSRLLVAPTEVVRAAFLDDKGVTVWLGTATSLIRMFTGFAIGAFFGLVMGVFTGTAVLAERSLSPTLNALRQITLFAWMPLLTGWFGNGEATRIVYISLSAFFPIAFSVHEGIQRIPSNYREVASVLRLGRRRRLTALLLPAALPSLCTGMQVGFLTAWLATVSAEYVIGVSNGLGSLIVFGREQFRMELVLLGVLFLSIVGYALNVFSTSARKYLLRNHGVAR